MAVLDFQPKPWTPPVAPPAVRNTRLSAAELWPVGPGPEDVAIDSAGCAYVGLEDGSILRIGAAGKPIEELANTGGRPLGIEVDRDGSLVVCDAKMGLLRVSQAGRVKVLVNQYEGEPFGFTNNAAIASNGSIYFTDTSTRFGIENHLLDLLEHSGTGRLFLYRPDGLTELLLEGLQFANGVALSPDESSLWVAETGAYRIRRLWLSGTRAGSSDIFADNLPGFPDNLSNYQDTLWVAIPTPRDRIFDWLMPRPWLRKLYVRLPGFLQRGPRRHGFVLGLNSTGEIIHNLQDPSGRIWMVSGVRQAGRRLYVGSLTAESVAVLDLAGLC